MLKITPHTSRAQQLIPALQLQETGKEPADRRSFVFKIQVEGFVRIESNRIESKHNRSLKIRKLAVCFN